MVFRGGGDAQPIARTYRELLALAIRMGASVSYLQPEVSVEIPMTIESLALETPGISVDELAELIPVRPDVIRHHAPRLGCGTGLNIDLEN